MRKTLRLATLVLLAATLGCNHGPKSGAGFRLPDGDVERGKAVFLKLSCNSCHKIAGLELQPPDKAYNNLRPVVLGGEVLKVQTYGQLVTSIINPSHSLAPGYPREMVQVEGKSAMTNFNDVMTVSELIDLVAFLQSRYKLMPTGEWVGP